jgi:hypothetical protein
LTTLARRRTYTPQRVPVTSPTDLYTDTYTDGYGNVPAVVLSSTLVGACPDGGTLASVLTKYGTTASVRGFSPGVFGTAVERPATASRVHWSWKPTLTSTLTDAMLVNAFDNLVAGDMVEVWHESDVKLRNGTFTLTDFQNAMRLKNDLHSRVVRLRDAGTIPQLRTVCTLSGWTVDQTSTWTATAPSNVAGAGSALSNADVLGIDMDGMAADPAFYDYYARQTGAKFVAAMTAGGYSGWTVPEFCMPSVTGDTNNAGRIAWFQDQVSKLRSGVAGSNLPGPQMIAWFDTAGVIGASERLTGAAEIDAWRQLASANGSPPPVPVPVAGFRPVVVPAVAGAGAQLRRVDGPRLKLAGVCVWGISDFITTSFGTDQYNNRAAIVNTIRSWGANHIRFRILANNANSAADVTKLQEWVNLTTAAGMYSSICWWDSLDGYAEDANWPARYQSAFPQMQSVVAALGPTNPYVFYEPFNEPNSFGAWGSNAQWDQWLTAWKATLSHFRVTCNYKGVIAVDTIDWSHGWSDTYMGQLEAYDAGLAGMTRHNLMFCKHDYANEYPTPDSGFDAGKWIGDTGGSTTSHVLYESEFGNYNGSAASVHIAWSQSACGYLGDAAWAARSNYAGATPFLFGPWFDANAMTAANMTTPTTWGFAVRDFLTKSNVSPV